MLRSNRKGFTLVELLVVIAIIGILASIVLVSLNTARERSRDARRVADISSIRTALEVFFLDNTAYPAALAELVTGGQIGLIPNDPTGNAYGYARCASTRDFTLGITLENVNDPVLDNNINAGSCGTIACANATGNYCVEP